MSITPSLLEDNGNTNEETIQVVVPHLLIRILMHLRPEEQDAFQDLVNRLTEENINRSDLPFYSPRGPKSPGKGQQGERPCQNR